MSILVDTHVLIWSLIAPDRLPTAVTRCLLDPERAKLVSPVTFWEISLKSALGKLDLQGIDPEGLVDEAIAAGFRHTPIDPRHAATLFKLPEKTKHKDPFDRLLIWQCIEEGFEMLTVDTRFAEYAEHGLTLAA
ncbi:MAG: type II toxin-antitoxin system VapC family toxin [Spirochaetaceae bacterium]